MASAYKPKPWASSSDGEFRRQVSSFREQISKDPGAEFPPEAGRYHLTISWACPWACRTAMVRKLKGLDDVISMNVVEWFLGPKGWKFEEDDPVRKELYGGKEYLREVYLESNPDYDARITVPVLYDKKTKRIVNNESADIIRMLYYNFDDLLEAKYKGLDLYPAKLREQIDASNEWIYPDINNGVYRSGFATTQKAYETAVKQLWKSLDRVEGMLAESQGPFLFGDQLTEGDVRLFTTIVRFDPVYAIHFKCVRYIRFEYPNLHKWLRYMYWEVPGVKETVNFEHIKHHYFESHKHINPFGIVPAGPLPNILPL